MKKRITSKIIAIAFCISLSSTIAIAQQGMLSKVSLENQVASSTLIVEGKVISKKSYWDVNYQNIFTVNEIEVYKVFKGQSLTTIEVVTPGGMVGYQAEQVSPSLGLAIKDIGVFMLYENDKLLTSDAESDFTKFRPYSGIQGFYRYNIIKNTAVNSFNIKEGIPNFYQELETLTGMNKIDLTNFDITTFTESNSVLAVAITSILPTTATGGTATVLTITGTGFGATKGTVGFSNADDGGATYSLALDSQVLTWVDTEITVEVPTKAGTGDVAVFHFDDATSDVSSETLTIDYSESTAIADVGSGLEAFEVRHNDDNASGGYTWNMFTGFDADAPAKASFMRALETWRCETGVNWVIGTTTSVDVIADDGVNVIRYDIGTELPVGVLGRCTSRFSGCSSPGGVPPWFWYVYELDIVFNDATDWEYGPALAAGSKVDFESVAVHELGHGHQLAHRIAVGEVMHYSIASAFNIRTLSTEEITGATHVQMRSTSTAVCGTSSMTDHVCTVSVADQLLAESIVLYPNPTSNKLIIQNDLFLNLETATIFDVSGRKLITKDISEIKILDISKLSQGIYFIDILSDNASTTKRFIVE